MEVAEQPQGERAVQCSVMGRAHGVGLVDQAEGGLRIATREGLGGPAQQIVLSASARLVHVGSPDPGYMNSV